MDQVSESHVCCYVSVMIRGHHPSLPLSVLICESIRHGEGQAADLLSKIRTIELDGKRIKLQIVSGCISIDVGLS
jgi:hypothetical protein